MTKTKRVPWNKGLKKGQHSSLENMGFKKGHPRFANSGAKKGSIPWNKNKKTGLVPKTAFKKGQSAWNKGKHLTDEWKDKIRKAIKGDKSILWKGGISFLPYTVDWTETLKRGIRERDRYTCQACGKEPSIHCHHIDYDKKNCNPDNLITLCKSCHGKTNQNRNYWQKYLSKLVIEKVQRLNREYPNLG